MNTGVNDCVVHFFFFPYQNQNHRRGWTSASCTRTPLAWWPRWDRRVGGPLGCSHLFRAGDRFVGRRSGVFPLWSAGWRGGGCAWRRPESEDCPLTCSRLNWPEPGYHGSSAHRLRGGKTKRGDLLFFKAKNGSYHSTRFTPRVTAGEKYLCVLHPCAVQSRSFDRRNYVWLECRKAKNSYSTSRHATAPAQRRGNSSQAVPVCFSHALHCYFEDKSCYARRQPALW